MVQVLFNEDLCKGCQLCISACPHKVLKIDASRVNALGYNPAIYHNPEACTGCASCAKMCPDSVITVRK